MIKEELKQARKQGGTIVLSLSGFVEEGKYYKIRKEEDGTIIIKEVEIKEKTIEDKPKAPKYIRSELKYMEDMVVGRSEDDKEKIQEEIDILKERYNI